MEPITIDFETMAIVGNPLVDPPQPIGVAVWVPGEDPWYRELDPSRKPGERAKQYDPELVTILTDLWYGGKPLLFHNAPFDLCVAQTWLKLEFPAWNLVHDTQYLLFLDNPYGELGLKPASDRILKLPPDEQDELHNWIVANVREATKKTAGAYIYCAPIPLVEKYAIGDVQRTRWLFDELHHRMEEAENAECV